MNIVLVLLFKKIDWVESFIFLCILGLIFRKGSIEKGSIAQVRAYGGREAFLSNFEQTGFYFGWIRLSKHRMSTQKNTGVRRLILILNKNCV